MKANELRRKFEDLNYDCEAKEQVINYLKAFRSFQNGTTEEYKEKTLTLKEEINVSI